MTFPNCECAGVPSGAVVRLASVLVPFAQAKVASNNNPTQCGGKMVVNVNFTLVNDFDSGVLGNAWANDTINRHLQLFDLGSGTFCATVNETGSFVTFAGNSPNGVVNGLTAGITGRINGGYTTTVFTGTYAPTLPTKAIWARSTSSAGRPPLQATIALVRPTVRACSTRATSARP